nr:hypothetical protein Iba_chr09eCG8850 [Ipomoea batatas]
MFSVESGQGRALPGLNSSSFHTQPRAPLPPRLEDLDPEGQARSHQGLSLVFVGQWEISDQKTAVNSAASTTTGASAAADGGGAAPGQRRGRAIPRGRFLRPGGYRLGTALTHAPIERKTRIRLGGGVVEP